MAKVVLKIEPSNGISLPEIGHLAHGEHELELTQEQIKLYSSDEAEGVSVVQTAANPAKPAKPEGEELVAAIVDATQSLDQADESLWTKTPGVPQTSALAEVLGYSVTAAERDAALGTQQV